MTHPDAPTDHLSADPDDLDAPVPDDPGSSTGLERPLPAVGPVADAPVRDPEPLVDDSDRPG